MPLAADLTLWTHALAALFFGLLLLSQWRHAGEALPRLAFVVALGTTALWALAVAGIGGEELVPRILECARNLAWLAFMFALVGRNRSPAPIRAVAVVYAMVGLIVVIVAGLTVAEGIARAPAMLPAIFAAHVALRMMVAVGALVLVHHLHLSIIPSARGGVRMLVAAFAAMWTVDLLLYAFAYINGHNLPALVVMRGFAMALIAPAFAIAVHRSGDWTLQVSRTVTYRSLSVAAIGLYLLAVMLGTGLIGSLAGSAARMMQTAFVLGSGVALLTLVSTPQLHAWAKVKLAKHLFTHRYDYRQDWLRFTETLGKPGTEAAPLEERIVKAVAELTGSAGGVLLGAVGGGLEPAAACNWEAGQGGDAALAGLLESTGHIVDVAAVREGHADGCWIEHVPSWIVMRGDAWVLMPLLHFGKLVGAILLAKPLADRRPDWEDFDLLRIAGRQAASYLAEARTHEALAEAQRFDEFNRRFAFILHDIKNLVSQLTLVARNAERHADNPAFRADMVATLNDSAGRMNDLLARLSQHHSTRSDSVEPVDIGLLVDKVARRRRALHPITVQAKAGAVAVADPARVEQVLGHLIQNAVDASRPGDPVTVDVGLQAGMVSVDVIDIGVGMSAAFLRDKLFKPFVSSKAGGFGLGAFEARQIVEAMGGRVEVVSCEGQGTRFRLLLPAAAADADLVRAA